MSRTQDPERNSVSTKFWKGGINSFLHPTDIGADEYAWAENVINRGGIIQTRPGFELRASVPGNRVQGFAVFTPRNSTTRLLIAVDGEIYRATWPGFNFVKIEGPRFNPASPLINFCECLQSTKRKDDNSIEIIDPVRVVIISDGENPAWAYDGVTATKMNPNTPDFQTPIGLWMAWCASRLWIGCGSQVRVSDLGNPTSFYEDQFLATRSFFELPDIITGMIETANERGLLVFTQRTTTAFQSNIRDRASWGATPGFQKQIFPNIGCDAGRTACNQYGLTYWHSLQGMVSLDAALNTDHSSKLLAMDNQMMRSKRLLSPDMSQACAATFENMLLVSVPSGGKYNEQTWVMDQAPLENILDTASVWTSVWSGLRPVQWASGKIGGHVRLFCATYDRTPANDTHIHVWEAMRDDRTDAGGRIQCQLQQAVMSDPRTMKFKYAEFEVVEMLGDVSLKVFVGGTRGPWMPVGEFELRAEEGSIGGPGQLTLGTDTILRAYKPQSRTLRTREFNPQRLDCSPEFSGKRPGQDKGFALLFEWKGRMGLHDVRLVLQAAEESDRGKCSPTEAGKTNIVLETGEAV